METMQLKNDGVHQEKSKFLESFSKILSVLKTYKVYVKNLADEKSSIDILTSEKCTVAEPEWFTNEHGIGKTICGNSTYNVIVITAKNSGKLKIWFRGIDKYCDNKRFPVWIDYKSIKINSKELLTAPVKTWHDEPYFYEMPVEAGQKVKVEFEQDYHNYTLEEMKVSVTKLFPSYGYSEDFYNFYCDCKKKKSEHTWNSVKNNSLTIEPKCISVDEISSDTFGRLKISIGSTKFETLFVPSETKKLYVNLTAIGKVETEYPKFTRVSWCDKFDGNFICFDDPTRDELKIAPAFYFGNEKENYLEYLQKIIEKITSVNNIPSENVTFFSSSNGGFASLYLADKIPGSRVIALCPQVDAIKWANNTFCKQLKFDENEYKDRLQVYRILKNTQSHFFIFSNISGWSDKAQMECLYKEAGVEFKSGVYQLAPNVRCMLAEIDAPVPHLAQPAELFVRYIENTMTEPITEEVMTFYNLYLKEMEEIYAEQKKELA